MQMNHEYANELDEYANESLSHTMPLRQQYTGI